MVSSYNWFTFCFLLQVMLSVHSTTMPGDLGYLSSWYLIFYNESQANALFILTSFGRPLIYPGMQRPKAKIQFCSLDIHIIYPNCWSPMACGMGPLRRVGCRQAICGWQVKATKVAGHFQFENMKVRKVFRIVFFFSFDKNPFAACKSKNCMFSFHMAFFFFFPTLFWG